jgi:hypothetical protein
MDSGVWNGVSDDSLHRVVAVSSSLHSSEEIEAGDVEEDPTRDDGAVFFGREQCARVSGA